MRISDWSSDVCSSDLPGIGWRGNLGPAIAAVIAPVQLHAEMAQVQRGIKRSVPRIVQHHADRRSHEGGAGDVPVALSLAAQFEQALDRKSTRLNSSH